MKGFVRALVLTVLMAVIIVPSPIVAAPGHVPVLMDGSEVVFSDDFGYPFIDQASRTLMPFRVLLETFGASVNWDESTRTAVAQKGDIQVEVPIGERFIIRNTEVIVIDTASVIVDGRTYIPLRAVMEAFECDVYWNEALGQVEITSPKPQTIISRMPEYYDLRSFNRTTVVKDQGNIGACWAFATLGAMESCISINDRFDFSEDHMSLTHGYNLSQDDGGDFQISLAYLARWSGPVYEFEDPYADGVANEEAVAAVHVQEAKILPEKDYAAIKRAIMQYGGVQTSIHIRDIVNHEFGDAYNPETNAFYYDGQTQPNHDVVIVGWDDTYAIERFTNPPEMPGAFVCRNSYGDTFGDGGYFYVSYEDTWIGDESIVYTRIDDKDNYDSIYQTDWLGWVGRIGYGKETAYFSNVYRADEAETLEAVSFYATDRDTSYEVYVIPEFEGLDDFRDMTYVTRGSLDYVGYYTVDFDEPIEVEGDFAVVVKVTTPDSLFPVAAEFYKDVAWLKEVDITDGRGYMSYDGELWESTEEMLQSNVALKAFTKKIDRTERE